MKFKITYTVGKETREKIIIAKDLDNATTITEKQKLKWIEISMIRRGKNFLG